MGKREINKTIKIITQMLEITTDKKQRADLTKIIKQAKLDWQELDDKAPKRKPKKPIVKVAPVVQDDNYKPKKIIIEQKERVNIKSAINGIFQDITIEDDFGYMKEIKPEPEITMEVFKNKSSKVKYVKPTSKQPLTKGQRNLMNVIEQQLTKQFNNNPKFSLFTNVLIKYQVYRIINQDIDEEANSIDILEYRDGYYNTKVSSCKLLAAVTGQQ